MCTFFVSKDVIMCFLYGREEGIRTLDTVRYTRFPGELFQPLRHLSINFISAILFDVMYVLIIRVCRIHLVQRTMLQEGGLD